MIIYRITNLLNGKCYIGQDSKNNPKYFGSGVYIKRAIKKYGKDNFRKDILQYCKDVEELNKQESFWIKKINTFVPNGYNVKDGGKGGGGCAEETKIKISNANMGRKISEEAKQKISIFNKKRFDNEEERLRISVATKKGMTEEVRKKISDKKMGVPRSTYHKDSRTILICKYCTQEFKSYRKTAIFCNIECKNLYDKQFLKQCICGYCNNIFYRKESAVRYNRVYCSKGCYNKSIMGDNHPSRRRNVSA